MLNKEENILQFLKYITIVFNIVCVIFLCITISLPSVVATSFKLLLFTTTVFSSIGLLIALLLSQNKHYQYSLFFCVLLTFLNGLIIGISIAIVIIF